MTISPQILQSMLKRNATTINELHEYIQAYKSDAVECKLLSKEFPAAEAVQAMLMQADRFYKEVDKMTKTVKKLVAIQKELKAELRNNKEYFIPVNSPVVDETLSNKAAWQSYWAGHDDATELYAKPIPTLSGDLK